MPCLIRKVYEDRHENFIELATGEWQLTEQIEALSQWLKKNHGALDRNFKWVADIGFKSRLDATGGGPVITTSLMKLCVECRLSIFLSEYGSKV